jgi:hypothetical protein
VACSRLNFTLTFIYNIYIHIYFLLDMFHRQTKKLRKTLDRSKHVVLRNRSNLAVLRKILI